MMLDTLSKNIFTNIFWPAMERGTLQNSMTARTKRRKETETRLLLSIYFEATVRKG